MNKADFTAAVAAKLGGTKTDAAKAVDAVLDAITEVLAKGDDIRLPGFGTFEVRETAEKKGRNPRTGEEVTIAAGRQPKFKAGAVLKSAVGGEKASA